MNESTIDNFELPNETEIQEFINEHQNRYSENYLRERALEDAKSNIPSPNSNEASPFEKELLHAMATLASKVVSRYKQALEVIDAKVKAEEDFVARAHKHAVEAAETEAQVERDAADNAHALKDAHKNLEKSEQRYNALYEKHGRGPIEYIPHWLFVILAILIFAGEIPLNALVFQIFGENVIMTWVMAFIVGLCVPLSAHFIGIKFREHGDRIAFGNIFKGLLGLTIMVVALYGLSIMRQVYLGEFQKELGLTERLVDSSFQFFWLNLAVLAAAIMISYLAHDAIPGFQESRNTYEKARKYVQKRESTRVKTLKNAASRRAKLLKEANEEHRDGINRVNRMKGAYDLVLIQGKEAEQGLVGRLNRELSIYRSENLKHRTDKATPPCFSNSLSFPIKMENMAEKLVN